MRQLIALAGLTLCLAAGSATGFAQAGSLDPTFGQGGRVRTNLGSGNTLATTGAALAPDGDIVVSGNLTLATNDVLGEIFRYLPSGALDPTFGNKGVVKVPIPAGITPPKSLIFGATVTPAGQILTVLDAFSFTNSASEKALVRLNLNGQLDPTFGKGGLVVLNFPVPTGYDVDAEIALLQPDGKIVLAGGATPPFRSKAPPLTLLARFLPTGALDTTFGSGGMVETVAVSVPTAAKLIGGDIFVGNFQGEIAEFSPGGALLQVSPPPGTVTVNAGQTGTFQPNGELLLAHSVGSPELFKDNSDATVSRFDFAGDDSSFTAALIRLEPDAPFARNGPAGVALDANGRIVVGIDFANQTVTGIVSVARLDANGSLDPTFGRNGVGTIMQTFTVTAVLVQPNNDIVTVGNGQLARYLGN